MKKAWYRTNKGKIVLMLLFPPLILYFMWKYAPWQRETKWRVTTAFLVVALFAQPLMYMDKSYNKPRPQQVIQTTPVTNTPTTTAPQTVEPEKTIAPTDVPQQTPQFEIKEKKVTNTVENYKVLVASPKDGFLASIEVLDQCSKPCNITIFDNEQALNLQKDFDSMSASPNTSPAQLTAWKEKNYVFVADHLVGYMTFDTEEYLDYPYKDWYYEELKAKN